MSDRDDIVTRARAHGTEYRTSEKSRILTDQLADEIERLQAIIAGWEDPDRQPMSGGKITFD